MQVDALTMQADALTIQADALTMQADALTMQANALTMQANAFIRPLGICAFYKRGKRVKVKGEGDNTELFPLPPCPFPDLCKKSIVIAGYCQI
ncbi:MAG: hypothetical protein RMY33_010135 [Nostoc sp. DedQUE03]|nr:hypothetical protein [Nostoc sp. DedQUE02]